MRSIMQAPAIPNLAFPTATALAKTLSTAAENLATVAQSLGHMATQEGLPTDIIRGMEIVATEVEGLCRDVRHRANFMDALRAA